MLESLFNKVADAKACTFINTRLQQKCFPVNTVKFVRTPVLKNLRTVASVTPYYFANQRSLGKLKT